MFPHFLRALASVVTAATVLFPVTASADPLHPWLLPPLMVLERTDPPRPAVVTYHELRTLRWSLIGVQALDVHSTITAVRTGAREANLAMRPFAGSVPVLIALKGVSTWLALRSADTLAKHNRKAAFWFLAASNVALSAIVVHNYRTAAAGRQR
jgi:hypothetical protein